MTLRVAQDGERLQPLARPPVLVWKVVTESSRQLGKVHFTLSERLSQQHGGAKLQHLDTAGHPAGMDHCVGTKRTHSL